MHARLYESTAREGQDAYITVVREDRHSPHIRPSTPLRAGQPIYVIEQTYEPRNMPPFSETTAFRQRAHALTWFAVVNKTSA